MIEAVHADLSISAQCRLLSIGRSSFYYAPQPESDETLALMRVIDAAFLDMPWYGRRQMVRHLRRQGVNIGRRRVRRLTARDRSGLVTVSCRSPISLCHLGFECERADAAQI
jgi:putative transposase